MADASTHVVADEATSAGKKFKTELTDCSLRHSDNTGPYADNLDVDAIIVGAGFSESPLPPPPSHAPSVRPLMNPTLLGGVFMLKTLRERGFKAVVFEAGNDLGGTWRFNCYPGARVDSPMPTYEFSWPEVYNTWNWTTNYVSMPNVPGRALASGEKLTLSYPSRIIENCAPTLTMSTRLSGSKRTARSTPW